MTSKNKAFLDANVLVEVLCKSRFSSQAEAVMYRTAQAGCISTLTGHLDVHFRPKGLSIEAVEGFLGDFAMLDLTEADFE